MLVRSSRALAALARGSDIRPGAYRRLCDFAPYAAGRTQSPTAATAPRPWRVAWLLGGPGPRSVRSSETASQPSETALEIKFHSVLGICPERRAPVPSGPTRHSPIALQENVQNRDR